MYTDEQAQHALFDKLVSDLKKQIALDNHKRAIEWVNTFNLPYRISLDYLKNKHDVMDVEINSYYPLPQVPIGGEWNFDDGLTFDERLKILTRPIDGAMQGERTILEFYTPKEIQAKIDDKGKPYRLWDLETEQGKKKWLYYFAIFILPYSGEIQSWGCFDIYGDKAHEQQEVEERKQYYLDLVEYCLNNPTEYKHEVQRKQLSDYDKYNFKDGYMWHDTMDAEPPQCDAETALAIMRKEKERYLKKHNEYELNNQYSEGYRIQQIIDRLEREKDK